MDDHDIEREWLAKWQGNFIKCVRLICFSTIAWALISAVLMGGLVTEVSVVKFTTLNSHTYGSDNPLFPLSVTPTSIRYVVAEIVVGCVGLFLADQLIIEPIWSHWGKLEKAFNFIRHK